MKEEFNVLIPIYVDLPLFGPVAPVNRVVHHFYSDLGYFDLFSLNSYVCIFLNRQVKSWIF